MIFSIAELLAFCSEHFVLEPGDVLLTGTPPGVGMSMSPPQALSPGDTVEVEVEHIGILSNGVEELSVP
jgi:2-keto-4-pentenoate hydratase/2-oxohepta-3-ene-1,7-dioic acid hydratase in catechol pathway